MRGSVAEVDISHRVCKGRCMAAPVPIAKFVLWTSSVGIALFLARRLFARRKGAIDVGAVSDAWLAQQRWPPADPFGV
jgi:hypothetical protein